MDLCSKVSGATQTDKLILCERLNLDSVYRQIVGIALVAAFQHLLQVSKWMKKNILSLVKYFYC